MKTRNMMLLLAATLAVGGVVAPAAAAERNLPGRPRGGLLQRAATRLELTAGQQAQIKALLHGEQENLKLLLARLHEARAELRETIRGQNATEAGVRSAAAKVAAVEADLAVERLKLHGKIAPILTAEQTARLADMEARVDEFVTAALARQGEP